MKKLYFYADQLTVGYGKKTILGPLRIEVKRGEILTLIGPNGAGKSTVLKSIAGQLRLLGGTVYLDGTSFPAMSGRERSRRMAVVFTERLHTEYMSCRQVVAAGRYPYTGRFGILSERDWEAVDEAMEAVHAAELRDRDFGTVSDGQRQRIMLARAICQEPEIILLDEPTSFLDVHYKLEFMAVLQELTRKKKVAVIMSLHELDLAERISDRILCVNGREPERLGTPEEIFRDGYVARLFGISQGTFTEEGGGVELPAPQGEPDVFVIAGGGSGRQVFWKLQRAGIPFAAGILYENDVDFPTARALASRVVIARAFEPMGEKEAGEARRLIDRCRYVICCRSEFGTLEQENRALKEYAAKKGKWKDLQDLV